MELNQQQLRFSMGDAEITSSFATETSVSFKVRIGGFLGWIDVHFPCGGHIKVQVRAALPMAWLEPAKMRELIKAILEHLGISKNETCEAVFFHPQNTIMIAQAMSRDGKTDRIA
ncbi:MAG TPA: hypothetical protein VKM56_13305 [Verrucomicrobiae bacterium]|nr:hypothetical protein [Verrucomicrobiae bacterium]